MKNSAELLKAYSAIRTQTEHICSFLKTEDCVVQPVDFVSPPKWHLGHTTWFFERMILIPFCPDYKVYDSQYNFIFNSYYENLGARVIRTHRGNLSRPSVEDIYLYRRYVDKAMQDFLTTGLPEEIQEIIILGINHEQQHQELLYTDIKYILGHNPLFPPYTTDTCIEDVYMDGDNEWIEIQEGMHSIGCDGKGFCYDNELNLHQVYLSSYAISANPVSNEDYLEFISSGGYENFNFWHSEGWEWREKNKVMAPLYWYKVDNEWHNYTLGGFKKVNHEQPVSHVNFYEASAYASWKGHRLPTEFEWEAAADNFRWGHRWEWTNSAYLPYPGFKIADGALGEYNGKFMVNQMVLRGASVATPEGHARKTYRNFFHPHLQWQYSGIRLAK